MHSTHHTFLTTLLACAALLLSSACATTSPTKPIPPPTFGPDLRTNAPNTNPTQRAWQQWLQGNTQDAHTSLSKLLQTEDTPTNLSPNTLFGHAETSFHTLHLNDALSSHIALLKHHPTHPLTQWSAARIYALRDYVPSWEESIQSLTQDLASQTLPPSTRAFLSLSESAALLRLQRRNPNTTHTPFLAHHVGSPNAWKAAGPFSVYPLIDATTPTPADTQPHLQESYTVANIPRTTRTLHVDSPDFALPFQTAGTYVLESFLTVDKTQHVTAHIHTSAPYARVSLNDTPILLRDARSSSPPQRIAAALTLNPGTHRIRIHISVPTFNIPLQFALTPLQVSPINPSTEPTHGLHFTALPPGFQAPATAQATTPTTSLPSTSFFTPLTPQHTQGHPSLLYLQALHHSNIKQHDQARAILAQLNRTQPSWSAPFYAHADAWRDDPTVPYTTQEERAIALWRDALKADPTTLHASDRIAFALYARGQTKSALSLLDELARARPDSFIVLYHRYLLFRDRNWTAEAQNTLRTLTNQNPDNCTLITEQWNLWARLEQRPTPTQLPKTAFQCDITLEQLAFYHDLPRKNLNDATQRLLQLTRRNPSSSPYLQNLASLQTQQGQHERAEHTWNKAMEISSDPVGVGLQYIDNQLASSPKTALNTLQKLLKTNPGSYSYQRLQARLTNTHVLASLKVDPKPIFQRAFSSPSTPASGATYLLDYAATRVFPDASSMTVTHIILHVHNKEGIDAFGEVNIPEGALPLILRTVKPDGRTIEPEFFTGDKPTISMPNLAPGDIIEYQYIEATEPTALQRGAYLSTRFYFQTFDAPMLRSEFVLEVPNDWSPTFDPKNNPPQPTITQTPNGFTQYRFTARTSPQRIEEPLSFLPIAHIPSVQMSHAYSWTDATRTHADNLAAQTTPNHDLTHTTHTLLKGAKTTTERTRRIFSFLRSNIEDDLSGLFSSSATHTLTAQQGDRTTLMLAMLRAANIPHDLLFVRPNNTALISSPIPLFDLYSTPILRVQADDTTLWLNPSLDHSIFNSIPPDLLGAHAIVISPNPTQETLFTTLPTTSPTPHTHTLTVDLNISPKGDASGTLTERWTGHEAAQLRRSLDQFTNPDELQQALAENLTSSFPGLSIQNLTVDQRDAPDAPLTLTITLTSSGFARLQNSTLTIDRPFLPSLLEPSFAELPTRTTALTNTFPLQQTQLWTLHLPKNYTARVLSSGAQTITSDFGTLTRTVTTPKPNTLHLKTLLTLPTQVIPPNDYTSFKTFTQRADRAERLHIQATP